MYPRGEGKANKEKLRYIMSYAMRGVVRLSSHPWACAIMIPKIFPMMALESNIPFPNSVV